MKRQRSIWYLIWQQLKHDYLGFVGLILVFSFLIMACGVWLGFWGIGWSQITDSLQKAPSVQHWFGTNSIGQDVAQRAIYSSKAAFEIGIVVTFFSVFIGTVLGAVAGYQHGRVIDHVIVWMLGVLDAIPFYLFAAAVAYAFQNFPFSMHIAMIAVFWTTTARIIRAEVIKLKHMPFIQAAQSLGLTSNIVLFKHVIPNTIHLILIQATITFVAAIKTEVILSFLGLGMNDGVSWGIMISEATNDIQAGYFNNFIAASTFLFLLVIGFNLLSDALQDALSPKHINRGQYG